MKYSAENAALPAGKAGWSLLLPVFLLVVLLLPRGAALAAADAMPLANEELQEGVDAYRQQIQQIETEFGPYDPSLTEVLMDLGRWYQEQEQHEAAVEVFARALHTTRVNAGLYDAGQIQILDRLIASLRATRDWQQVDDRHHLLFQLQQRHHAKGSSGYLAAVAALGEWRLQANADNLLGRSMGQQLRETAALQALYQEAIDTSAPDDAGNPPALLAIVYGQAVAAYQESRLLVQLPLSYFEGRGSRYLVRTVCYPGGGQSVSFETEAGEPQLIEAQAGGVSVDSQGNVTRVCTTERVDNPDYYLSQRYEQRMQLDRSAMSLQAGLNQLRLVLQSTQGLSKEETDFYQAQLVELETLHKDLQRDIRRNSFRWSVGNF